MKQTQCSSSTKVAHFMCSLLLVLVAFMSIYEPKKHFKFPHGLETSRLFPSPTGWQVERKTKTLKEALLYRDHNTLGLPSKGTYLDTLSYNPRTIEVPWASWYFFQFASREGKEKGRKIQSLAETEGVSLSSNFFFLFLWQCQNKKEILMLWINF